MNKISLFTLMLILFNIYLSALSFNPETTISFLLQSDCNVLLEIYNIKGAKVTTLASSYYKAGQHNVVWHGKDSAGTSVASGIYFFKMTTPEYSSVKKMILMK